MFADTVQKDMALCVQIDNLSRFLHNDERNNL